MRTPKKSRLDTLVDQMLGALADVVYHYPRLFFYPQVILTLACICFTVFKLEFHTKREALVGADKKYHANFLKLKRDFQVENDLVVVVESEDLEKNRQFVERLGSRMEREPQFFKDVFYKGDLKMLGRKALLFVPDDQLLELKKALTVYSPVIQHFTRATNFSSLFDLVNTQFRTAKREKNAENQSLVDALPLLERILVQGRENLLRTGTPVSPGLNALFGSREEAEQRLYITFNQGRIYMVNARPANTEGSQAAMKRLRQLIAQVEQEVPGVNVGLTGELVLELDEMAQSQADTTVATVVALVVCALIFVYGYQETGRPIKATACLVVGVAYTMGFTTLAIGHLNVLTITFVPILIGLAIDFGVHLISRYEEEMRHGRTREEAIHKAMVQTGRGIFTGCLTTAGAFLAIGFTEFRGIQEMGLICGAGLLLCLVPMMTLLPVLLLRGRQNVIDHARAADTSSRARIERIWLSRPWLTLAVVVAGSTLAVLQIKNVRFDYNLLHMQSDGLPAVEYEKKLINSAEKSVLFAALVATNIEQALELESRAKALPSVAMADSIAPFLSGDQSRKLALVGEIKQVVAPLKFLAPDTAPANIQELSQVLWSLSGYLGLALEELEGTGAQTELPGQPGPKAASGPIAPASEDIALAARLRSLRNAILDLRKELFKGDAAQAAAKMGAYQHAFFDDVQTTFETIRNQDNRDRLRVEDLPAALRNRFVGKSGNFMVMVYPKRDVWEREPQAEFIGQLRTVDPNVTGTPVQLYEYTSLLLNSYLEAAGYALIAIIVMVLIYFRSLVCLMLALMPVALGALWMAGMMGVRDIMFNPANIMTLPLVIGIGVTNGIHVLTRFSEEQHPSIFDRSTGKAVLVSGLTTIAGFGSLMLAKHQGIASLGFVMSVGVTTCMILGLIALPALLSILLRLGWKIRR